MSYFGGLGAGKGWNTFNFIITPQEFESIFKDQKYYFVITNSRVEIDYEKTDDQFFFAGYDIFFNKVITGPEKLDRKEQWPLESITRISITDNISKIHFRDILNKKGIISNEYKGVEPQEPVINVSPFYLYYFKTKESLSVAYMHQEGTIGLQLTYPKFVSFRKDDFKIIDAHTFTTYTLFKNLIKNIKNISNKAKVQSSTKLFRPNFWISPEAKKGINNNHYLKSNGLNII